MIPLGFAGGVISISLRFSKAVFKNHSFLESSVLKVLLIFEANAA